MIMIREVTDSQNTMATLDNWIVSARLSDTERDKWDEKNNDTERQINDLTLEKLQYERTIRELQKELAEAQLKDIPVNAEDRKTMSGWTVALAVVAIIEFLLLLFGVSLKP